jgi:hypothetical protein
MNTRLFTLLSNRASDSKVKHYLGAPPELTGGKDTRQEMGAAALLVLDETSEGVFLYRHDAKGEVVGDTWHMTIDEGKRAGGF